MEELNELKNLVIQTLEANGSLSNVRAQIRSSVFKIVDEPSSDKKVLIHFNPGISLPLVKRQMPRSGLGRVWQRTDHADQRVFPILQHGLYQLRVRV